MNQIATLLASIVACAMLLLPHLASAQTTPAIPVAITTPDKVETCIGTLDFKDRAPSNATLEKAYDQIDFTHAYNAFVNTMQGVSLVAAHRGALEAGVKDNEILVFSTLMDCKSLFLTANADTVYFVGFIDVSKGPMVFEVPPKTLVKTPEVEVAGGLGIYGGQFKYNLNASGTRQGQQVNIDTTASTTVPLPLIGLTLDWYIDPRWKVSANVEGIKAHIGNVDGSTIVAEAITEYMLTRNFGLGLAYMYSDVSVDVTKSNFNGNLGWKMNSVRAYGQLKL